MDCMAPPHEIYCSRIAFNSKVEVENRLKKKFYLTLPQICLILSAILQTRKYFYKNTVTIINYYIRRNHIAYQSHRKTTLLNYQREKRAKNQVGDIDCTLMSS